MGSRVALPIGSSDRPPDFWLRTVTRTQEMSPPQRWREISPRSFLPAGWAWLWLVGVLACGCFGRTPADGDGVEPSSFAGRGGRDQVVEIDLSAAVSEGAQAGLLPIPADRTYLGLVHELIRLATAPTARAILVKLGEGELGYARTAEVGRLLSRIRERGKPVVCHADGLGNTGAWLALAGCDRIWLSPAGRVDAVGIAGQILYFKAALDALRVRADFVAMGRYKSAIETYTREGPSEDARAVFRETFGSLRRTWLDGMRAGRKGNRNIPGELERGPFSPEEAKARGIVDEIGYASDALAEAQAKGNTSVVSKGFGPKSGEGEVDIAEVIRALSGADSYGGGRPRIAVVPALGAITMGGGGSWLATEGITERALSKTLRRLAKDESVKAVVLRIDSPGGSALASDLLWHELMKLRERTPIVASVGDMAASGGYYLACAANKIVAEPTSIVGSIGVFGGKITVDEALAEWGINAVTIPASPEEGAAERAGYPSPLIPWNDSTRERVRSQMRSVYDLFLRRVAEGRNTNKEAIHRVAQGRIYSGVQGKDRGLVDELGGLSRALELAREIGQLDSSAPASIEGASDSLLDRLLLEEGATPGQIAAAAGQWEARRRHPAMLALSSRLGAHVATLAPLLDGETVVAALPFAVAVE